MRLTGMVVLAAMAWTGGAYADRYVSPYGGNTAPYDAWSNAANSIQTAINAASVNETIWVTNNTTYTLSAEITLAKNVTVQGFGGEPKPVINGNGSVRVFNISSSGAVVDGLVISNGFNSTSGGGITMTGGTVQNCVVVTNRANSNGGGVYMTGGTVRNSDILWNQVPTTSGDVRGGGIYLGGGIVSNCTIRYNFCDRRYGGVALMAAGVKLLNSVLEGNRSRTFPGAGAGFEAAALIDDCTFTNNVAVGVGGGGVNVNTAGAIVQNSRFYANQSYAGGGAYMDAAGLISNCVFIGNIGTGEGGALYVSAGVVASCIMRGNSGGGSGGGGVMARSSGRAVLRNCLIASNTATAYAGGVISINANGLVLEHCTVVSNNLSGFFQWSAGTAYASNSIIVDHPNPPNYTAQIGYSCVPGLTGNGNISADPAFVDRATGDYRLAKGSPCIDTAVNLGVTLDLDGVGRPTRNGFDMGCYEEWQLPIIANRAPVADSTSVTARAIFTYESTGIVTYAWFVLDTADQGTNNIAGWWQFASPGSFTQGVIFSQAFTGLTPGTTYRTRCVSSNDYDLSWGPVATFVTPAAGGATRLWTGAGANALASNTNNWLNGLAPGASDYVLLDTSSSNMTWDAAAGTGVARWTQTENYTGTVTFETTFPSYSTAFTNFAIAGDCLLTGGRWTHLYNGSSQRYRLCLSVGGDWTFSAGTIIAKALGYTSDTGPGGSVAGGYEEGGSHGGVGGGSSKLPYGSPVEPVDIGSGGARPDPEGRGGGAIYISVAGAALVNGTLDADSADMPHSSHGAGGSIFLRAATLSGNGIFTAGCGAGGFSDRGRGAGGRIALHLTSPGATFAGFGGATRAFTGGSDGEKGGAGTVYRRDGDGYGELIIDNNGISGNYTAGATNGTDYTAISRIVTRNGGRLMVRTGDTFNFGGGNLAYPWNLRLATTSGMAFPNPWALTNATLSCDPGLTLSCDLIVGNQGTLQPSWALRDFDLTISGNCTVASGGAIQADSQGFSSSSWIDNLGVIHGGGNVTGGGTALTGPGRSPSGSRDGASFGGQGGETAYGGSTVNGLIGPCYGGILTPRVPGSSTINGPGAGGGVLKLTVQGSLDVQSGGRISSDGAADNESTGSGGAVNLTVQTLTGGGAIRALGGTATGPYGAGGGGGRVAVRATAGTLAAFTGTVSSAAYNYTVNENGAGGSVYLEDNASGSGRGEARFDFNSVPTLRYAEFPASYTGSVTYPAASGYAGDSDTALRQAVVDLRNKARVSMSRSLTVRDLRVSTNSYLLTGTNILYVDALEHHLNNPSQRGMGVTTMVDNYAHIVWIGKGSGTIILVR